MALKSKALNEEIERFTKKLKGEDYLLAQVDEPSIQYSQNKDEAIVIINLKLGPKIKIIFTGNKYFYERNSRLRQTLRIAEEKQFSSTWVEAAKYELERFYKLLGYARVNVSYEDRVHKVSSVNH